MMSADGNLKQLKIKIARDEFIEGMQTVFKDVQKLQEKTPPIKKALKCCGQDPDDYPDLVDFTNNLLS